MAKSNLSSTQPCRAVIVTALRLEFQEVQAYLNDVGEETFEGSIYTRGSFTAGSQVWAICLVETGPGNPSAAFETERAIRYFRPDVVLFVGIAGGLADKGVKVGDVVCVTRVYAYESGRSGTTFQARPVSWSTTYDLEQRAKAEGRKKDWLQRLTQVEGTVSARTPQVFVEPIAAGEKVMASTKSDLYNFLRSNYNDAIAVEMESVGFLQAAHANRSVRAMVIRGISDLLDNKEQSTDTEDQPRAARHASAFAFEMLAKLTPSTPSTLEPINNIVKEPPVPTSSPKPANTFEVFYSFAKEDRSYAEKLHKHLILLKRAGFISESFAGEITLDRDPNKMKPLDTADIIFLLISDDFLVSEETYDVQMQRAMERHQNGEATVIPILIRPTANLADTPFGKLQALPRSHKPISSFRDPDEAFAEIAKEIRAAIQKIRGK